jgi:ABC-type Fe3+ transport system substrate-binding protein
MLHPPVRLSVVLLTLLIVAGPSTDEFPPLDPLDEETPTLKPQRPAVAGAVRIGTDLDHASLEPALAIVRASNPDLRIHVVAAPSAPASEGAVDLLLFGTPAPVRIWAASGHLAPLDKDVLGLVPERFHGPSDTSMAVSVRAHGIVAGRLMANRPLSVLDLGASRWSGKVARPSGADAAFVELVAVTLVDNGEGKTGQFLGGLRANTRAPGLVLNDTAAVLQAVVDRKAAIGWIEHVDMHRYLFPDFAPSLHPTAAQGVVAEARLELLLPDRHRKGVPWTATVAAIPKNAQTAQATAVLAGLLTTEGQTAFSIGRREYAVLDELAEPPGAPTRADFLWSEAGLTPRSEWIRDALYLGEQVDLPQPGAD